MTGFTELDTMDFVEFLDTDIPQAENAIDAIIASMGRV